MRQLFTSPRRPNVHVCSVPSHLRRRRCRRRNAPGGQPAPASRRPPHRPRPGRPAGRADGWVTSTLARMTLEEKVGQLFIQNVYGKDATTPDARNIPLYGVASPAEVVQKYHLGGVIYFAWTDSVQNPPADRRPVQRPAEGRPRRSPPRSGSRCRSRPTRSRAWSPASARPATQFPGSMALGAGRSDRRRPHRGRDHRRASCKAMGVNTDFAPDCRRQRQRAQPGHRHAVVLLRPDAGRRAWSAAQVAGYQARRRRLVLGQALPRSRRHGDRQPRRLPDHHPHPRAVGADRRAAVQGRDRRAAST